MIKFKISHGLELDEFVAFLTLWQQEPHYPGLLWQRYRGTSSDIFEVWGHDPLLTYAKLRWG